MDFWFKAWIIRIILGSFLGIETSFDLKYYNTCFDAWIKSYNCLKLQPKIISFILWKLRTAIDLLFFSRKNIGWTPKIKQIKKIQRIWRKLRNEFQRLIQLQQIEIKQNTSMENVHFVLWFVT